MSAEVRTAAILMTCLSSAVGCQSSPRGDGGKAMATAEARTSGDPALPGISAADPKLMTELKQELGKKDAKYRPRTHHFNEDGSPKYINRLIRETSPYLLQHAHNPVNWYAWGDEAFERARAEKKPVLLSIGYSTCHWCHVMERESFEDVEIAAYLNEHFVCVKVDREERPDVDDIYMSAVQMLTGRGGWPMTTVLNADRQPFFGGTYFPARDGDRGSRKGFFTILRELKERYDKDPDGVAKEAAALSQRIASASQAAVPAGMPTADLIVSAAKQAARSFDAHNGGFGRAPKFPTPVRLELLLRFYRRTGDSGALKMVTTTLDKMAAGGIYDHAGGGFHRYAVDQKWLVPHFEKMLYDNAQLASLYTEAFQATERADYARVAREILDYVQREMTDGAGGFYSATDADSLTPKGHDEEGYFFTWTPQELEQVLDPKSARLLATAYDVRPGGNFEGRSILNKKRPLSEVATELNMEVDELVYETRKSLDALYEARKRRPPPIKDDKILTSWNGLMIAAFASAGVVLQHRGYVQTASKAARFILDHMRTPEGRLLRSHHSGQARHTGYLDDYAFFIHGLLQLFDATSDPAWLASAVELQGHLDRHYADELGGYFMTADDGEKLLARDKPSYDGAEPSGNAVAILNLLQLGELTQDAAFRKRAEASLTAFSGALKRRGGGGMSKMLSALDFYQDRVREVFVVGPADDREGRKPLDRTLRAAYLPNRIVVTTTDGDPLQTLAAKIPLLEGKSALKGKPTAFVCTMGNCELPTSDPDVFEQQLAKTEPYFADREVEPLLVP